MKEGCGIDRLPSSFIVLQQEREIGVEGCLRGDSSLAW